MNYQAFTNDALTMMYEAARGALAADDALNRQGIATKFRVRETPEWKTHPLISNRKCSSAECFSRSSTGRKIRRPCLSTRAQVRAALRARRFEEFSCAWVNCDT